MSCLTEPDQLCPEIICGDAWINLESLRIEAGQGIQHILDVAGLNGGVGVMQLGISLLQDGDPHPTRPALAGLPAGAPEGGREGFRERGQLVINNDIVPIALMHKPHHVDASPFVVVDEERPDAELLPGENTDRREEIAVVQAALLDGFRVGRGGEEDRCDAWLELLGPLPLNLPPCQAAGFGAEGRGVCGKIRVGVLGPGRQVPQGRGEVGSMAILGPHRSRPGAARLAGNPSGLLSLSGLLCPAGLLGLSGLLGLGAQSGQAGQPGQPGLEGLLALAGQLSLLNRVLGASSAQRASSASSCCRASSWMGRWASSCRRASAKSWT
eukprot:GAFH01001715.1.p2 GENE.GAFH01001715.1~~GAFH01001715.1.p2  ORF type:complete len:326 (+),score=47.25 GAFH01001715.1:388-1365(+)